MGAIYALVHYFVAYFQFQKVYLSFIINHNFIEERITFCRVSGLHPREWK